MRFLIAAALFVISVFMLVFGLAQRTIWAPPEAHVAEVSIENPSSLVVVPNSVLTSYPGTPVIEAMGSETVFIATGRQSDIEAWIGTVSHNQLAVGDAKTGVQAEFVMGSENVGTPVGSDLWRDFTNDEIDASLPVSTADENAVLLASDGVAPAPNRIRLVWSIVPDFTSSNILLIGGGVVLLAAFIMNLIAYQTMRRNRGPRRRTPTPPKPPRYRAKKTKGNAPVKGRRSARRRAFIAVPATLSVLSLLTGCQLLPVAEPSPSPSASASDAPPAVVTEPQLKRILADVAAVALSGDDAKDAKLLKSRIVGPALAIRTTHYKLQKKSDTVAALPAIVDSPLSFSLPAASTAWPRVVMAVTDAPGDEALPQMLVLQQDTPRSKYRLWYNIRLMPGAEIPGVAGSDIGAIPVESDSLFLKLEPKALPAAYGDAINKGQASLSFSLFDTAEDEFFIQVSASQKKQIETLTEAKITFTHKLGNPNVPALSTSDSGALVAVYMTDTYKIKPKSAGSAVAVSGQEKLLLGTDGSTTGVTSVYGNMLLFYVPALSEADKKARLLGVTQGLLSVKVL